MLKIVLRQLKFSMTEVLKKREITLQEALNGPDLDLNEIEITDQPLQESQAINVLKTYHALSPAKKAIIEKTILTNRGAIPKNVYAAFNYFHTAKNNSQFALESTLGFEEDVEKSVAYVWAMLLAQNSEETLRKIARSIRRVAHYKIAESAGMFTFNKEDKERTLALGMIQKLDKAVQMFAPGLSLVKIYQSEFAAKPYEPTPEEKQNDFTYKTVWNISTIKSFLDSETDWAPANLSTAITWALFAYIQNDLLRTGIESHKLLPRLAAQIDNPEAQISAFRAVKEVQKKFPSLPESAKVILSKVYSSDIHSWFDLFKLFTLCKTGNQDKELGEIAVTNIARQTPKNILDLLSQESITELPLLYHALASETRDRIQKSLTVQSLFERPPALVALIFKDFPEAAKRISAEVVSASSSQSPEVRTRVIDRLKHALSLAGMDEEIFNFDRDLAKSIVEMEGIVIRQISGEIDLVKSRIATLLEGKTADQKVATILNEKTPSSKAELEDYRNRLKTLEKTLSAPAERRRPESEKADKEKESPKEKPKRPGELTVEEFTKAIEAGYRRLNLPQALAVNIGVSKRGDERIISTVRRDLEDTAAAALELMPWANGEEKTVKVEEKSALAYFGIAAVQFRKTQSFEVEFLFRESQEEGKPTAFCPAVHMNDHGQPEAKNFHNDPLLRAILETESVRYLCQLLGETVPGATNDEILILLGLQDMPAPEPSPEPPKPAPTAPTFEPTPEPEPAREARNFVYENWETFEEFMQTLATKVKIKESFAKLDAIVSQLGAGIVVDKAIPSLGVTVEMREGHVLSNFVNSIDIYDPATTRTTFKKLNIDPKFIHVDSLDKLDAYFVRINVKINEEDEQICACIIPPTNRVYYFGVDPQEIIDEERSEPMALTQMILRAFKMAVMREDNPEFTSAKNNKGSSTRKGAVYVNKIITEATHTSYPPIVTSWSPSDNEESEQSSTSTGKSKKPHGLEVDQYVKAKFEEIALGDDLSQDLANFGVLINSGLLFRLLPKSTKFERHNHFDVFMPINDPEVLTELFEIYRQKKFVTTPADQDWLLETMSRPEVDDTDAINALNFIAANPGREPWEVDRFFAAQCRKKFPGENAYERLIRTVQNECQTTPGLESATVKEIYQALRGISYLNPDQLKLATSRPVDYRLAYRFREGGKEMPTDALFTKGYEVGSGIDMEVVQVIAGNRARMSRESELWLRGDNRSEEMDFASKVQNRLVRSKTEVDLSPRARALLVWEFLDQDAERKYAFAYLDTARDALDPESLTKIIPASERLKNFARVQTKADQAFRENFSGKHTDFDDHRKWSRSALRKFEEHGILELEKDGVGRITGIKKGSVKNITRKRILILEEEQVGYRQFRFDPATFTDYMDYAQSEGLLDEGFNYESKTAQIQKVIYKHLGL